MTSKQTLKALKEMARLSQKNKTIYVNKVLFNDLVSLKSHINNLSKSIERALRQVKYDKKNKTN